MSLSPSQPAPLDAAAPPPGSAPAWKNEVSARVRAHRGRRGRVPENQPALPGMEAAVSHSSVAARVAERYARVPSWKDMLAAQAAAAAAAEKAALAAPEPQKPLTPEPPAPAQSAHAAPPQVHDPEPEPYQPDLLRYSVSADSLPAPRSAPTQAHAQSLAHLLPGDAALVDPLEEAVVEPLRPLPARVIEFPRELIAPRKARPRLAEGPLTTDAPPAATEDPLPADAASQLRIFEADPESAPPLATAPATSAAASQRPTSEWHSIQLDTDPPNRAAKPPSRTPLLDDMPLHVAPVADRFMAAIVDVALTLGAFLLFVLVFVACTTHPPAGRVAVAGAAATLLATWILYQLLFFSLSSATPGMRYAKIALCTFDDENPTRHALRTRIAALLLSALPLGLGFLWIVFDEDALGWHDRITQTYQRSYRQT
ncbi:MAG: RDD family protein [Acidobacteriaceae bacterium]